MQEPLTLDMNDPELPIIFKKVILNGGVVVTPTDTCYGLAANAFSEKAVKRIFVMKKRDQENPLSVAVSVKQLPEYADLSIIPAGIKLCEIPVPITLVLQPTKRFPSQLMSSGKVGFRLSGFNMMNKLLTSTGLVITSTSANITGGHEPYTVDEVLNNIALEKSDLIINGGILDKNTAVSAVIDLTQNLPRIIRDGIAVNDLMKLLNKYKMN